ncbi:MAG: hypothetical protein IPH59_05310 [bacterium]|nr:hypothetical protein [bacterium]
MKVETCASAVNRDELALDLRLDNYNQSRYPIVFSEGAIRVYRVPGGFDPTPRGSTDIARLAGSAAQDSF